MLCGDGVRGCHGWVTSHPKAAAEEGWHVKPWEEATEIPVLYRGNSLAYIRVDGSIKYLKE